MVWVNKGLYYPSLAQGLEKGPNVLCSIFLSKKGTNHTEKECGFLVMYQGLLKWVVVKHHFQGIYVLEVNEFCSTISSDVES